MGQKMKIAIIRKVNLPWSIKQISHAPRKEIAMLQRKKMWHDLQLKDKEICHALHNKYAMMGANYLPLCKKEDINGKIVCEFAIMAKYRVILP